MAKKDKGNKPEQSTQAPATGTQAPATNPEASVPTPTKVAANLFHAKIGEVEYPYTQTKGKTLKSKSKGKVKVDGEEVDAWITSSKGWSAPDKVLSYLWFAARGTFGYITAVEYNVEFKAEGQEITTVDGKGPKLLERVAGKPDTEKERIAKFQAKMAEKKPASEPTPAATEPTTQPAA